MFFRSSLRVRLQDFAELALLSTQSEPVNKMKGMSQVNESKKAKWVNFKLMVAEEEVSPEVMRMAREIEACRHVVYGDYCVHIGRKGELKVSKTVHAIRS